MRTLASEDHFKPAGSQPAGFLPISRRTFIAALVASPTFASAAAFKVPSPPRPDPDAPFLTFKEDSAGLTITLHRKSVSDVSWRLARRAFGSQAGFLLRTLTSGAQAGYEILVYHVQFGSRLHDRRYLIMFRPGKNGWDVTMRTDLWTSSYTPPANTMMKAPTARSLEPTLPLELTSTRVQFEQLVRAEGRLPLVFDVDGSLINASIDSLFEGHVACHGRMKLEFDRDCVWTLHAKSGRISAFDDEFDLEALELAWCEPLATAGQGKPLSDGASPCAQGVTIAQARGRESSPTNTSTALADPVFCATAKSSGLSNRVVGAPADDLNLQCEWDSKDRYFAFTRQDWDLKTGRAARGVAEMRGSMNLSILARGRLRFGRLELPQVVQRRQVITTEKQVRLETTFEGRVAPEGRDVKSPIGRLIVHGKPVDNTDKSPAAKRPRVTCEADDERTMVVVYRRAGGVHQPKSDDRLSSIDIKLLLLESDLAPPDTEDSNFQFTDAELRAVYRVDLTNDSAVWQPSYLWLGEEKSLQLPHTTSKMYQRPLAVIDLSRARLEVARSGSLVKLAFMFADMNLEVGSGDIRITRRTADCRVLPRGPVKGRQRWISGEYNLPRGSEAEIDNEPILDSRPTLVVEFPPQHVLEEAVFRPNGPGLPDVTLKDEEFPVDWTELSGDEQLRIGNDPTQKFSTKPRLLLTQIAPFSVDSRKKIREKYAGLKQSAGGDAAGKFQDFCTEFAKQQFPEKLSEDQKIYIGPYGMDPDVMSIAYRVVGASFEATVLKSLNKSLDEVNNLLKSLKGPDKADPGTPLGRMLKLLKSVYDDLTQPTDKTLDALARAKAYEAALAAVNSEYASFRDHYRAEMTRLIVASDDAFSGAPSTSAPGTAAADATPKLAKGYRPTTSNSTDLEYFSPSNRDGLSADDRKALEAREEVVRASYVQVLLNKETLPDFARAHLANPSRLAFRVDCDPANGSSTANQNRAPGHITFTMEGLTDWSTYELAVVPRAQAVTGSDVTEVEASDDRPPSNSDTARMLTRLGFKSGRYITAQERLSDVAASLRAPPSSIETSIEIPARLMLSPSQRAVWRTPSSLIKEVFLKLSEQRRKSDPHAPPGKKFSPRVALWTADLRVKDPEPGVRVIHSPDLRVGFLQSGVERAVWKYRDPNETLRTAGAAAPPRGPRAPWTLGVEEGDYQASNLERVYKNTSKSAATLDTIKSQLDDLCKTATNQGKADELSNGEKNFHPLFKYLCERRDAVARFRQHPDEWLFRASLDAYDRHELVLLSSAWGMPVRGRRGTDLEISPFGTSSQVEAPDNFKLIDVEATAALYNPRALRIQELRLSALGGTLRHDTTFVPPAAALHIGYGALFDALSIERWQHWVVLGRDVFAEVVYKGYLFPIGHRASLIKQTERVFLRRKTESKSEGVRAFLRQRMFIRIGQPNKAFPAIGHPNDGRQFPADTVRILTVNSPDIVDPAQDMFKDKLSADGPAPGGRMFLDWPGLVFWPRTARLAGFEVRFDMQIDNVFTSLPMIFVDNVAAHNPDLLSKVIAYYNREPSPDDSREPEKSEDINALKHKRTLDFGGQTQRYCDEVKPGASSHKTSRWTLRALGGVYTGPRKNDVDFTGDWEGTNTFFDDPLLEGADQPPFYPAVETARIRVDQVERFTGNTNAPVLVQFDGFYVANGFVPSSAQSSSDGASKPIDKLEIYLDILSTLYMSMGPSGDRSGGIFRPESQLVALCRKRGPLSGGARLDATKGDNSNRSALFTRVKEYMDPTPSDSPTKTESGQESAPPSYTQYFKPQGPSPKNLLQTRLFGLVTLSDLVKFCKSMKPPEEGLPVLQEVVQYGTSAVAESSEAIRTRVVKPLSEIVDQLQMKWDDLDKKLNPAAPDATATKFDKIELRDIFPDVYGALAALQAALKTSATSPQGAEFFASLAGIYEAGNRLVDALERASNSLPERVQGIALTKLSAPYDLVKNGPVKWLSGLKTEWEAKSKALVDTIAANMVGNEIDVAKFFPFPYPVLSQGIKEAATAQAAIVIDRATIRELLTTALHEALIAKPANKPAEQIVKDLLVKSVAAAKTRVDTVVAELTEAQQKAQQDKDSLGSQLRNLISNYETELANAIKAVNSYRQRLISWNAQLQSAGSIPEQLEAMQRIQLLVVGGVADLTRGFKDPSIGGLLSFGSAISKFIDAFTIEGIPKDAFSGSELLSALENAAASLDKTAKSLKADNESLLQQCIDDKTEAFFDSPDWPFKNPWYWTSASAFGGAIFNLANEAKSRSASANLDLAISKSLRKLGIQALRDGSRLALIAIQIRDLVKPLQFTDLAKLNIQEFARGCIYRSILITELSGTVARITSLQPPAGVKVPDDIDAAIGKAMVALLKEVTDLVKGVVDYYSAPDGRWTPFATVISKVGFLPRPIRTSAERFGSAINAAPGKLSTTLSELKSDKDKTWSGLIASNAADSVEALCAALSWGDPADPFAGRDSVDVAIAAFGQIWRQRILTVDSQAAREMSKLVVKFIGDETDEDQPSLIGLYATSVKLRRRAYDAVPEQMAALRQLLLVNVDKLTYPAVPKGPLGPDTDQLFYDWTSLKNVVSWCKSLVGILLERDKQLAIGTGSDAPREFLLQLLRGWEQGDASPLRILSQAKRFAIDGAREQLLRLVDFSSFREAIDHEIRQLLPVSTSVSYDYNLRLEEGAKEATKGVFCPGKGCDLNIHSKASVNFLDRKASFLASGDIGPFDIHLVGETFDAVTLMFNGATFHSVDGGALKCDVQYKDFKIGQKLKFLQDLAAIFGPKQGSGFYLQLLTGGLGLEAGYGLNIGTISIGTISFFNISLNSAVRLRFDGQASTFVASLSRRNSPFTISAAPYGGSGFFAIEADSKGIVGFEASFEYGGAAAFAYGPLQGQGRLMLGVYVRRDRTHTDIWGTFYVGGSASIWIFTFGASLYVCATMQDSKMVGDATFTFSFSMGLCDFSYSVQVHYEQQWSGSKSADAGASALDEPIMLAQSDYARSWDGRLTMSDVGPRYSTRRRKRRPTTASAPAFEPDHKRARIRADTYCQSDDWSRYREYFDLGLQIDTGFDV